MGGGFGGSYSGPGGGVPGFGGGAPQLDLNDPKVRAQVDQLMMMPETEIAKMPPNVQQMVYQVKSQMMQFRR